MKQTLLIIFILLGAWSGVNYGQVVINTNPSTYTYSTSGIGVISSYTYVTGKFYLCVHMRVDATTPADFTMSGTSSTWTEIANVTGVTTGTNLFRIKAWRYAPASDVTEALSFSDAALSDGSIVVLWEITGVITTGANGADAIVQVVTDAQDADADPTITMAALNAKNSVVAFFGNNVNPFGATPESGWTELSENGFNTPTTGGVFLSRHRTSDNTPSVTASASDWVGVAFELNAINRRSVIVN